MSERKRLMVPLANWGIRGCCFLPPAPSVVAQREMFARASVVSPAAAVISAGSAGLIWYLIFWAIFYFLFPFFSPMYLSQIFKNSQNEARIK